MIQNNSGFREIVFLNAVSYNEVFFQVLIQYTYYPHKERWGKNVYLVENKNEDNKKATYKKISNNL